MITIILERVSKIQMCDNPNRKVGENVLIRSLFIGTLLEKQQQHKHDFCMPTVQKKCIILHLLYWLF